MASSLAGNLVLCVRRSGYRLVKEFEAMAYDSPVARTLLEGILRLMMAAMVSPRGSCSTRTKSSPDARCKTTIVEKILQSEMSAADWPVCPHTITCVKHVIFLLRDLT